MNRGTMNEIDLIDARRYVGKEYTACVQYILCLSTLSTYILNKHHIQWQTTMLLRIYAYHISNHYLIHHSHTHSQLFLYSTTSLVFNDQSNLSSIDLYPSLLNQQYIDNHPSQSSSSSYRRSSSARAQLLFASIQIIAIAIYFDKLLRREYRHMH